MPHFVQDVEQIRQRAIKHIEDGPVTSTYGVEKEKAIGILNEALATEIVCVLRYMHHYFMATGVHGRTAADEFREHADQEREHADRVAERIQQLGGKPDFNPRSLMERSVAQYVEGETLGDMIREDLIAERVVIDVYRDMIRFFGNGDPTTRTMLEDILEDEEEHANDLADLLYIVNPATGETETQDPGTEIGRNGRERKMDTESQPRGGRQSMATSSRSSSSEKGRNRNEARETPGSSQSGQKPAGSARGSRGSEMEETASFEQHEQEGRRERGESRPARATDRQKPGSASKDVPPAHEPGTTGRVMARRGRNEVAPAEDDIELGGQSGGTRSPKVVEKNRKKRAA